MPVALDLPTGYRPLNIAFYAPFKPLDHPNPSGDLMIGRGLCSFLEVCGHKVVTVSRLRTRLIFQKPWVWPRLLVERRRIDRKLRHTKPDLWLTFHTYYKGPDLSGPAACRRFNIPYVIFQGIYATKYRRNLRTWPGYRANTDALKAAAHVFTNKKRDLHNLARIMAPDRLSYIAPGIEPHKFCFDPSARENLRKRLKIGRAPLIVTAAMFRPGVKTAGLMVVIEACGRLAKTIPDLRLLIIGDGREKEKIAAVAARVLPERAHFAGQVARERMSQYYSAGDLFAFPGINESLGMVFLEAQACGLPVVAYENAGVAEAVSDGVSGFLVPLNDEARFAAAIKRLVQNDTLRCRMGKAASDLVRSRHNLSANYRPMERCLQQIVHNYQN
jgi:glycosyltransferase involved in cell wall biosynthesis